FEKIKDAVPRSKAKPVVLLGVREGLALGVGARNLAGIELQRRVARPDQRVAPEMAHERLRLSETAREGDGELACLERCDLDIDSAAERRIEWQQRLAIVEIARRYRIGIDSLCWVDPLVDRAGDVHPAEFVDGGVERRQCRLARVLRVVAGDLEAQAVLQEE